MKRVGMLGVALGVLACSERETPRGDGTPVLVPIDSVVLTENDSVTLGLPNSLAVLPSGDFFVGDAAQPKVVRYGRDGKPRGTVGRRGSEPGEFRFPSRLTAVGDTTLLVGNASALQVLAFDTRSGKPRWVRRVPAQVSSMSAADNRLYIGFVGRNTGSIGVLDLPTSNEPTTANLPVPVTAIGPMPDLFTRAPTAATVFGIVELTAFGETIASAYEVSNHVYLTHRTRGVIDSIEIPPVKRRGARIDLFSAMTNNRTTAMAAYLKSSIPFALARLSSGVLAYVALDAVQGKRGIQGHHFLSIVDPARHAACVETQIPGSAEPPQRVAFSGDTLFTLSQQVTVTGRPTTVLRAYRIDTSGCRWRR